MMAAAPTGDEILQKYDLLEVAEALLEAKDKAYSLGLALKLSPNEVDSIRKTHQDPQERLTAIIRYLLKQVEPRPTWRLIVEALRSPLVDLPRLAKRIEAAHSFSHDTSPDNALDSTLEPELPSSQPLDQSDNSMSAPPTPTNESEKVAQKSPPGSPEPNTVTPRYVKAKISKFEKRFNQLKREIRDGLKQRNIPTDRITDALSDMPADDVPEHKQFQEACLHQLYRADDHNELFGTLNPHVNYLAYHLLDYLVDEFDLKIKNKMDAYKNDLQRFREKTSLKLFCETQKKRHIKLSSEFREVVTIFNWPNDVTLEVVEQFRQEYACHYKLRECAMMVAEVRPCSFIVTWYVPESVVEKLKTNVPEDILKIYSATKLEIDGSCVYKEGISQQSLIEFVSAEDIVEAGASGFTTRVQGHDSGFTTSPARQPTYSKVKNTITIILECHKLLSDIDKKLKEKAYSSHPYDTDALNFQFYPVNSEGMGCALDVTDSSERTLFQATDSDISVSVVELSDESSFEKMTNQLVYQKQILPRWKLTASFPKLLDHQQLRHVSSEFIGIQVTLEYSIVRY